jgi:tetratricopeptide (TPR) repeat protein
VAAIFLSYRRKDAQDVVGRIYDRLRERFPSASIFRDLDSIPLGKPFPQVLREAVGGAAVALVVIGPEWTTVRDEQGRRRLDDPGDFVRSEIETSLIAGIPVVPVLVSNAKMPKPEDLPESLRPLVERQGIEVHPDPYFHHDMDRLIGKLDGLMPVAPHDTVGPGVAEPAPGVRGRFLTWGRRKVVLKSIALLVGAMVLAVAAVWLCWPVSSVQRGKRLLKEGRAEEAARCFEAAIRESPATSLQVFELRAQALTLAGNSNPERALGWYKQGVEDYQAGRYGEARHDYELARQFDPFLFWADNNLAVLLAECPDRALQDPVQAVSLATEACKATDWKCWQTLDSLAIAYAAHGDFPGAARYEKEALGLAPAEARAELQGRLTSYEHPQATAR